MDAQDGMASSSAMQSTVIGNPSPERTGTLFVVMSSDTWDFFRRSIARSESTACDTPAMILVAPRSWRIFAALHKVPAVSVRSSTMITSRPSTSPITLSASISVALLRRLATMARLAPSAWE
ncbi:MAG: hypothetical protein WDN28_34055 [Chthoniobacter sp.]